MKKNRENISISGQFRRAIMSVNISILAVVFIVLFFYIRNVLTEESLMMADTQLQVNVNEFNKEFTNIESAVTVLESFILSNFDVDKALTDSDYVWEFNEGIVDDLQLIGERTDLASSVYVYFNHDVWGKAVDTWMLRVDEGVYERQEVLSMAFFEENYRGWYEEPIKTKQPIWTFPYLSIAGGTVDQIITSYVVPLEKDGIVIGVAGMDLYLTDVIRYLEDSRLYETGEIYLIYTDGRTIYHPRYEFGKVPKEINRFEEWLEEINTQNYGHLDVKADDQDYILAYKKIDNGWTMASMIPKGEVYDLFGNLLLVIMLIVAFTILFAFVISNYMSRRLSEPIVSISRVLSDISRGELDKTIPEVLLNSNQEISALVESAESMRKHLIADLNRIRFDNEHLESLVKERTAELYKVNEELEASLNQLENQQAVIVEAEKSKTSRYLIQNLAHRLNTPIGSTLIASDYLKSIDFSSDEAVCTSIDIIHTSQKNLKEIVDGMSKLLKNYEDLHMTSLNLKTTIDYCVKKFMFENDVKINYENLIDEDIEVRGVSNLYLEMFAHLLLYSYKENSDSMKVAIKYEDKLLKFIDYSILFEDKYLRVFEAYFDVNINSDKHGLEMFIAYDIATRGLGYKMYVDSNTRDHLEICIDTENV